VKYDMTNISVFIGMPSHRELSPQTNASLIETGAVLKTRNISYIQEVVYGSSIVHVARTNVTKRFLDTDMSRLFWIDSDMVWTAEDFLTILALSTELECVGATYPSKEMPPRFLMNLDKDVGVLETNEYGCFDQFKGFGLGFTCVQRKVMEQLAAKAPKLIFPGSPDPIPHVFRCDEDEGAFRGEDMAFFSDVRDLGYKVNLYPHINLGHVGPHVFRSDFMAALRDIHNASRDEARKTAEQGPCETAVRLLPRRPRSPKTPNHGRAAKGSARHNHQPATR
jgi:hypothetical protein